MCHLLHNHRCCYTSRRELLLSGKDIVYKDRVGPPKGGPAVDEQAVHLGDDEGHDSYHKELRCKVYVNYVKKNGFEIMALL